MQLDETERYIVSFVIRYIVRRASHSALCGSAAANAAGALSFLFHTDSLLPSLTAGGGQGMLKPLTAGCGGCAGEGGGSCCSAVTILRICVSR